MPSDKQYEPFPDDDNVTPAEPVETEAAEARDATAGTPALMDTNFSRMLADKRANTVEDPEAIQALITDRILKATTAEEVLAPQGARHARELLGVPLIVSDVRVQESDFGGGVAFYMILEATDSETGEQMAVSCGGRNVMAQLFRLWQLGALPAKVKFTQPDRPTAQGYFPLWLVAA